MGGIIPAVEKRVKVVVLNVGGMEMEKALLHQGDALVVRYLPRAGQLIARRHARSGVAGCSGRAWRKRVPSFAQHAKDGISIS
jgi:hypothetical protein